MEVVVESIELLEIDSNGMKYIEEENNMIRQRPATPEEEENEEDEEDEEDGDETDPEAIQLKMAKRLEIQMNRKKNNIKKHTKNEIEMKIQENNERDDFENVDNMDLKKKEY